MIDCIMLVKSPVLDSKSLSVLDEVMSIIEEDYLTKAEHVQIKMRS